METIGILGGMGPLATADLFQKIICYTDAHGDNDHIRVLIDNNTAIPDRTSHILGKGPDPLPMLVDSALRLEVAGATLLVMPCNTAHYYYPQIKQFLHIPFLNMIEETARAVKAAGPSAAGVGLLATTGTYAAGVYDKIFRHYGLTVIKPDADQQEIIMSIIYGIKSGSETLDEGGFRAVLGRLKAQGAQTFVLGCTELPIAWRQFAITENAVDPTAILAKSAVRAAGKQVKGES